VLERSPRLGPRNCKGRWAHVCITRINKSIILLISQNIRSRTYAKKIAEYLVLLTEKNPPNNFFRWAPSRTRLRTNNAPPNPPVCHCKAVLVSVIFQKIMTPAANHVNLWHTNFLGELKGVESSAAVCPAIQKQIVLKFLTCFVKK